MKHLAQVMAALCLVALATGSGPADAKSGKSSSGRQLLGVPVRRQPFDWVPVEARRRRLEGARSRQGPIARLWGGSSKKKEGHVVVGAPAPFAFRVTCVKPGNANRRFTYVGPTGKSSSKREGVSVHCN